MTIAAAVRELVLPGFAAVMEAPFSDRLVTAVFGPGVAAFRFPWARAERQRPLIALVVLVAGASALHAAKASD